MPRQHWSCPTSVLARRSGGLRSLSLLLLTGLLFGSAQVLPAEDADGLRELHRRAALHPKDALQHIQLCRADLAVGLVDEARRQARTAVELEPELFLTYQALGVALLHDPVGRPFGPGFDRAGAIAAQRRSLELNRFDLETWLHLALVHEYDEDGRRYRDPDGLAEAISIYRSLPESQLAKLAGTEHADNFAVALLHAERNQEVIDRLEEKASTPGQVGLLAAAIALVATPEEAIRRVEAAFPGDPTPRGQAFVEAATSLNRRRHYPEATVFYRAASAAFSDPPMLELLTQITERTRRWEDIPVEPDSPASLTRRLFEVITTYREGFLEHLLPLMADAWRHPPLRDRLLNISEEVSVLASGHSPMRPETSVPDQLLDLIVSTGTVTTHELPGLGQVVTFRTELAPEELAYVVVLEDGEYRIAAFEDDPETMGRYALEKARQDQADSARAWLDHAAERIGEPEPQTEPVGAETLFHRIWQRDDVPLETAAAVLSSGVLADESVVEVLRRALAESSGEVPQGTLEQALALALLTTDGEGEELLEAGSRVQAVTGDDSFVLAALDRLGRHDELLHHLDRKLEKHPDDHRTAAERAELLARMGKLDQAASAYEKILGRPDADATLLDRAAWLAVVRGAIDPPALRRAERAVAETESSSDRPLLTLATIYAGGGRLREAHRAIVQAMETRTDRLPRPDDWYVFGRIAEQSGLPEAAREYYERIGPPTDRGPVPTDVWSLAQKRLSALDTPEPDDANASEPAQR